MQLSQLSDKGKDQLALYVAQRRVVGMLAGEQGVSPINSTNNHQLSAIKTSPLVLSRRSSTTPATSAVTTSIRPQALPRASPRSTSSSAVPTTGLEKPSSNSAPTPSPGTRMSLSRSSPLVQPSCMFLTAPAPAVIPYSATWSRHTSGYHLSSGSVSTDSRLCIRVPSRSMLV